MTIEENKEARFSVLLYGADSKRLNGVEPDSSHETLEEAIEQAKESLIENDDAQSVEVYDEERRQVVFNENKEELEEEDNED